MAIAVPAKSFTCITVSKEEYRRIKAYADALGESVRSLIVRSVDNYASVIKTKYTLLTHIELTLLDIMYVLEELKLLKKELLEPHEKALETDPKGYLVFRAARVSDAITKLLEVEEKLEKLKKEIES